MKRITKDITPATADETAVQPKQDVVTDMFSTMGLDLQLNREDMTSIVTSRIEEATHAAIDDLNKKRAELTGKIQTSVKKVNELCLSEAIRQTKDLADQLQEAHFDTLRLARKFPGIPYSKKGKDEDEVKTPATTVAVNGLHDRTEPGAVKDIKNFQYTVQGLFTVSGILDLPDSADSVLLDFVEDRTALAKVEAQLIELRTSLGNIGRFERQARARITENMLQQSEAGREMLTKLSEIQSKPLQLLGKG